MRRRRTFRFRPTGLDHLEDRTVMSAAATLSIAQATTTTPVTAGQSQQQSLVDQVLGQVYQEFTNFTNQYRQVRDTYFANVGTLTKALPSSTTTTTTGTDPFATYQQQTQLLVGALTQQVLASINSPGGGAGPLVPYLQARLGGDQVGGLGHDLLDVTPVGTSGVTQGDLYQLSEQAITNALNATISAVQLYDAALYQVGNQFFSGQLQFRQLSNTVGTNPGGTQQQQQSVADQVLVNVDNAFNTFVTQFQQVRANYLGQSSPGGSGTFTNAAGDVKAYNQAVSQLTTTLAQQVVAIVGAPVGGATLLTPYLQARLGGTQLGGLTQQLTNVTGVGASSGGFTMATDQAIASALEATINSVRLYDYSLVLGAYELFNAAQAGDFKALRATGRGNAAGMVGRGTGTGANVGAHYRSPGSGVAHAISGTARGNSVNTGVNAGVGVYPNNGTGTANGGMVTAQAYTGPGSGYSGYGSFGSFGGVSSFGSGPFTYGGSPLTYNGVNFGNTYGLTGTTTMPFFGYGGLGGFAMTTTPYFTGYGTGLGFGNGFGAYSIGNPGLGYGFGGFYY